MILSIYRNKQNIKKARKEMKVIEFIVDKLEYLIAIGVFGYGVINESVFYVCVAIMMWVVYDTVDDWEAKNK